MGMSNSERQRLYRERKRREQNGDVDGDLVGFPLGEEPAQDKPFYPPLSKTAYPHVQGRDSEESWSLAPREVVPDFGTHIKKS